MPIQVAVREVSGNSDLRYTSYWITPTGIAGPSKAIDYNSRRLFLAISSGIQDITPAVVSKLWLGGLSGIEIDYPGNFPNGAIWTHKEYTRRSYFGLLEGEIWGDFFNSGQLSIVYELWCELDVDLDRPLREVERCGVYDSRTISVVIPNPAGNNTLALNANANRVSVIVQCIDTTTGSVTFVSTVADPVTAFVATQNPAPLTMAYRDYGPVITGALYIGGNSVSVGKTVRITEIYRIPTG